MITYGEKLSRRNAWRWIIRARFSSEGVSCFRPFDALDRYWMCLAAVDPVPAGYGH